MHEFGLIKDLLNKIDEIADENKAESVAKVNVWLGALSHITPEHFKEHFDEESKGRRAEGAELVVEHSEDERHPQAQDILLTSLEIS